eukprot:scaffold7205_cov523-Prasinococcus_capsulatus_cf.AAC.2
MSELVQVIPAGVGTLTTFTTSSSAIIGFKICAVGVWVFGEGPDPLSSFVIGCQDLVPLPPFPPEPMPSPVPSPLPAPTPTPDVPLPMPIPLPMPELGAPAPTPAPTLPGFADVILATEVVQPDGSFRVFMTNFVPVQGFAFSVAFNTGENIILIAAEGGRAVNDGLVVSVSLSGTVIGFSNDGSFIPPGITNGSPRIIEVPHVNSVDKNCMARLAQETAP